MGEVLSLTVDGEYGHLIIDDPPRNVMSRAFFATLARLREEELPRLPVRGLIVSGSGRHFSSGADIPELTRLLGGDDGGWLVADNHLSFTALESLPYPTVAAVRGCCFGVGLELALACGIRVAAERAVFSLPEAEFGLIPGCGGTARLQRKVGTARSMEMILTGRTIGAEDAWELGLVDIVVPKEALLDTARRAVEASR